MSHASPCIALASGGSGGHVFPAEALARELLGRGLKVVLITDQRGARFGEDVPVPVARIRASKMGQGLIGKARSFLEMGIGFLQAFRVLKKLRPSVVIGFGGYPSIPTLYAAAQLGIPIILHEQNAVLGRANRAMADKARVIATGFPHVVGVAGALKSRLVHTGNPVRAAFIALRGTPYLAPTPEGPIRLLVLGGSQGARVFSSVVPQALALLPDPVRRRIVIAQQCRKETLDEARAAFAAAGMEAELASFFTDVPERMGAAHLVIGRAGASTLAELTTVGRPSILVPFPHGHAGEQTANAESLAEAGGAWLIPEQAFTPDSLAVRLESLIAMPDALSQTAAAARAWGKISAADALADVVAQVVQEGRPAGG